MENSRPKVARDDIPGSEVVVDSEEYVTFLHDKNGDEASDYYIKRAGR